jgi:hypothetical protein
LIHISISDETHIRLFPPKIKSKNSSSDPNPTSLFTQEFTD